MSDAPALLVVDDEAPVLALVPQLFADDFPVLTAGSAEEALALVASQPVGVVIADQRMPGVTGLELLARLAAEHPAILRILLTAYADAAALAEAINAARVDHFVAKPWQNHELAALGRSAMETFRLRAANTALATDNARLVAELEAANVSLETENRALRRDVVDRYRLGEMIGTSPAMAEVFRLLEKAAGASAHVLLQGETGTGKELAATFIHQSSARRGRRLVTVNCGALPDTLLETELFGHVRGAFTGALRDRRGLMEEASGGTLFLDEIGEMSAAMQAKLLRVLEDGIVRPVGASQGTRVDVRVVCATHRDLRAEVEAGRFRRDLYYRVNVFPVSLPPLRTRTGDVARLAQHFFHRYAAASGRDLQPFTPAALHCLERWTWPGNVRELKNEVERAVALAEAGEALDVRHLSGEVAGDGAIDATLADEDGQGGALTDRLERIETLLVLRELERHGQNRTHAARALGISVRALQKKLVRWGLGPRGA